MGREVLQFYNSVFRGEIEPLICDILSSSSIGPYICYTIFRAFYSL